MQTTMLWPNGPRSSSIRPPGLANDYLNVFNEIVMMIELLPQMPHLADDIAAWSPVMYRDYFQRSALGGRVGALRAYDGLDPAFRAAFDRSAAQLAHRARRATSTVLARASDGPDALSTLCHTESRGLRKTLDRLAQIVNHGHPRRCNDRQACVTELFDAA